MLSLQIVSLYIWMSITGCTQSSGAQGDGQTRGTCPSNFKFCMTDGQCLGKQCLVQY